MLLTRSPRQHHHLQPSFRRRWWEEPRLAGECCSHCDLIGCWGSCKLGGFFSRCGEPQRCAARTLRKKDKQRYQYGNHCRFYGYHGSYGDQNRGRVGAEEDSRLRLLEADWFRDKYVLDIGCGTGHVTLAVGLRFNPAHILGVELDERLVHAARQNIRHFLSHDLVVEERVRKREDQEATQAAPFRPFPLSFRVSRGPLSAPPLFWSFSSTTSGFPNNVTFIQVREANISPVSSTCLSSSKL